ncbi:DUF3592 domain-containing protein [Amycolatopsis rifamycinica]|uniref:DUF3592 domain-containing protein n=1 Tax=Amycolatopsis rifamycinica TaxID=287986 RepID=A0A066TZA1_9PSEU|nr:DUF3592 domain-containing protein [Amycolatopsis rifamycinica]KDN18947.1 hypothetical protein DV20_27445 [Amycolatopsis rifamycinica]
MPDDSEWLPPAGAEAHDSVDLTAETRRLRVLGWRALVIAALWLVAAGGAFTGLVLYKSSAGALLRDGARVSGTVLTVHDRPREIHVTYSVRGEPYVAAIRVTSNRRYVQGSTVTVVYDPADPARARTTLEDGLDPRGTVFFWMVGVGLLTAVVLSLVGWGRWSLRHRAVLRTGWRPAAVTVRPDPATRYRHRPDLLVEYGDGSRAGLRATLSSHRSTWLRHRSGRPAWVGGSGGEMVVLFETGPGQRPYAVPAYGREARTGT